MPNEACPKCLGDGMYEDKIEEWVEVICSCGNDPDCEECEGSGRYTEWQMRIEYIDCDC